MTIHTAALSSSALLSARYDDETQDLTVTFVSGRDYSHPGVPPEVFEGLKQARSAGSFYNTEIKNVYQ